MRRNGELVRLKSCPMARPRARVEPYRPTPADLAAVRRSLTVDGPGYRDLLRDVVRLIAEGATMRQVMTHASMTASGVLAFCDRAGIRPPRLAERKRGR